MDNKRYRSPAPVSDHARRSSQICGISGVTAKNFFSGFQFVVRLESGGSHQVTDTISINYL